MPKQPVPPETHRIPVADGEAIVIDWIPPAAGNSDVAIFIHGLGSHRRGDKALHFAARFADLGWGFLSVDLRGHGESNGDIRQLSMSRCLQDMEAVFAWLPKTVRPTLVIGSSMGGAVAAWHCLLQPASDRLAVFIAPSLGFPSRWSQNLSIGELATWQQNGVHRFKSAWIDLEIGWGLVEDGRLYDPQRLVREYATPTLILHGMQDVAVDWQASVKFVQDCPYPHLDLTLIKSGDHRLTDWKSYLFDAMLAWLRARGALRP